MIFVHQNLNDIISRKVKNPIISKTFGLLLGSKTKTKNRYIIHINYIMPLGRLKPGKDPRALTDKRWNAVQNRVYNLYPSWEIVGWYGVRNGWGAMLTEQDQRIHREFFTKSWQVICLLDNSNGCSSFFYWDRDRLKLSSGHYEYWDKNSQETLSNFQRTKVLLLYGSCAVLAVISLAFLYQQYGKDYLAKKHDKNSIGYIHETSDNAKTPSEARNHDNKQQGNLQEDESSQEKSPTEQPAQDVKGYIDRIAQLERELEEKEKNIQALKGKILSESSEKQDEANSEEGVIYIIQRGDNLYKISKKFYNTDKYATALARINRIRDQKSLAIGSYIIIPSIEEIKNMK